MWKIDIPAEAMELFSRFSEEKAASRCDEQTKRNSRDGDGKRFWKTQNVISCFTHPTCSLSLSYKAIRRSGERWLAPRRFRLSDSIVWYTHIVHHIHQLLLAHEFWLKKKSSSNVSRDGRIRKVAIKVANFLHHMFILETWKLHEAYRQPNVTASMFPLLLMHSWCLSID